MNDENLAPSQLAIIKTARRANKPLMERRRRQRINNCLDELKAILETLSKTESSYLSKLEKADILELTVQCIRSLKRRQAEGDSAVCRSDAESYALGYDACVAEVIRCFRSRRANDDSSSQSGVLTGLLDHLVKRRSDFVPHSGSVKSIADFTPNLTTTSTKTLQRHILSTSYSQPYASGRDHQTGPSIANKDFTSVNIVCDNDRISLSPECSSSTASSAVSTTAAAATNDVTRQPSSVRAAPYSLMPSHHRTPLSTLQSRTCGGSRFIVRSSPDVAVVHDADRLRRQFNCPADETPTTSFARDQFSQRLPLPVDRQMASSSNDSNYLSASVGFSFWNDAESKSQETASTSDPAINVENSINQIQNKSNDMIFETADSAKMSPMWRPW